MSVLFANGALGGGTNGFRFVIDQFQGISLETGTGPGGSATPARSNAAVITANEWQHIAVTVDKTNGIARIYLNGQDITSVQAIRTDFGTNLGTNPRIGNFVGTTLTDWQYKGDVDDFRIFDTVLSASEVAALMLVPVPEPSTLLSAIMGMGIFVLRRKRA